MLVEIKSKKSYLTCLVIASDLLYTIQLLLSRSKNYKYSHCLFIFLFAHFNTCILYSVYLFGTRWFFTIDLFCECFIPNIRLLLKTRTYYVADLTVLTFFKLRFRETFTLINFVTRILLIETLYKFDLRV